MANQDEVLRYHGVLQKMNHKEKIDLIHSLVQSGGKKNLSLLMDLLGDPQYDFRRAAFKEICKFGSEIFEEVVELYDQGNEDQRYWAVQLMVQMGEKAVGGLELALKDSEPTIQRQAIDELGRLKLKSSVRPLLLIFRDGPWSVRSAAFQALCAYGDEIAPEVREHLDSESEDLVFWCVRLLGKMGFSSRKPLYAIMKKAGPGLKFVIASALGESGDEKALALLIRCFEEDSWIHCKRASDALVDVGPAAIPALKQALQKSKPKQFFWFARTLVRLKDEGMDVLVDFVESCQEVFLWNIRDSLMDLGKDLVPILSRLIHAQNKMVRFFAWQLTADFGRPEVLGLLKQGLSDSNWPCRKLCADALSELGPSVVEELKSLVGSADEDEMYWLIQVLKKHQEGREVLVQCLRKENKSIVSQAAVALRGKTPEKAILPLLLCLQREEWIIRKEAADTLLCAENLAMEQVVQSLSIEEDELRFWISYILKRYPTRCYPYLTTLLYRPGFPTHLAARAMGIIGDSYFKIPLKEALREGDDLLVLNCSWSLCKISPEEEVKAIWGLLSKMDLKQNPLLEELVNEFRTSAGQYLVDGLLSTHPMHKENSVYLCGKLGVVAGAEKLREFLTGQDKNLAVMSAQALFEMRTPGLAALFRELLKQKTSEELRLKLLTCLTALEDSDEFIGHILMMMNEAKEDADRARYAREILRMGTDSIPGLIQSLSMSHIPSRKTAAEMLLEFGSLAVNPLKEVQQSGDPDQKFWAGKILKTIQNHGS